jgi:UDP-N-acetylmuramate--alanine ligase
MRGGEGLIVDETTHASLERLQAEDLRGRRLHFMGAGGIGVSALMELARARGADVSGCDESSGGQVAHLRRLGIPVFSGHDPSHVEECDELIYTPAVPDNHPELLRARELGKTVTVRMRMLGRLARGTHAVCVTGSHGKTTTTWMIGHLLVQAEHDPTVLVGGVVPSLGSNFRLGAGFKPGSGGEFVVETDESDNRLAEMIPVLPVVTNVDNDHLDHYGTLENLQHAIAGFLASAKRSGDELAALVGCGDDPLARRALEEASAASGLPVFDYGFESSRRVQARRVRGEGMGWRFDVAGPFGVWEDLTLAMPGRHNVLNALAAVTVAWRLGVSEAAVRDGLARCERVGRRSEIKGTVRGVRVVDDYGHHPTEIAANLRAARDTSVGRVGVLFQPHRYTRTQLLLEDFARCFAECRADAVFLLPVYAASEEPIEGADHAALAARIRRLGFPCVRALRNRAEAVDALSAWAHSGDTIMIQGAGDVTKAADELLLRLRGGLISMLRKGA